MNTKFRAAGLIRDNDTDRILYVEERKDIVTANADLAFLATLDGYRGGHVEECRPDGFWVIAISRDPQLSEDWQAVKAVLRENLAEHVNKYPWLGVDKSGGIFAHPEKPEHNGSGTGWSLSVDNKRFGEWLHVGSIGEACPHWRTMLIATKELIIYSEIVTTNRLEMESLSTDRKEDE